jgi:hypothetical protein
MSNPLVSLEPNGQATVLSYNVPEPVRYTCNSLIRLDFGPEYFKPALRKETSELANRIKATDKAALTTEISETMATGINNNSLFPNVRLMRGTLRAVAKPVTVETTAISGAGAAVETAALKIEGASLRISPALAAIKPEEIAANMLAGKQLNVYTNMYGTLSHNYIPIPEAIPPRLYLVETYQLSSYLGNYGAGRVVKTFSLLPGEKTHISIKTYKKTESQAKEASSILDSLTEESADEFENSVRDEQSDKENQSENFSYYADAEVEASWGFGKAKVKGGVKGGTNSSREEFSKNVFSAAEKHVGKASAKRDINVNTSYEVKEEAGEETAIEREIENINLSRTLNFVFRQMNQEFITLLHLVDVRVGFFNGIIEDKREVTLPELDSLLDDVIIDDARKKAEVKEAILGELKVVLDYQDKPHEFIQEVKPAGEGGVSYIRIKKDYISKYIDNATGTGIDVPGIITGARKFVMRTEGVVADSLLGQGEALDGYALRLQELEVEREAAQAELSKALAMQDELAAKAIKDNDGARCQMVAELHKARQSKECIGEIKITKSGD